jgi:hypothetical protein
MQNATKPLFSERQLGVNGRNYWEPSLWTGEVAGWKKLQID